MTFPEFESCHFERMATFHLMTCPDLARFELSILEMIHDTYGDSFTQRISFTDCQSRCLQIDRAFSCGDNFADFFGFVFLFSIQGLVSRGTAASGDKRPR